MAMVECPVTLQVPGLHSCQDLPLSCPGFSAGTRLVWVVDPRARTVTVHRPGAPMLFGVMDELSAGDVLPGFGAPVLALFPD